ncbi:GrpE-domain-containing protein [Trametes coccinea BRFM310]|uniref:GrpE protein homolog, mitochondrial n=1 Tax=Trametes coccinea (strain BRFM310) TaxID=1353009 RepID=A0A1Y2J5K1_TRAC3|nr:GrpE-domain-containing protein [Trametes coccinea BRFM310]
MFNAQAAQIFRSCTGALSSRTLARSATPAVARRAALAMSSRHYSDDKSQSADKSGAQNGEAEANEKDEVEVSPETELLHKLKAEESKVADCMSRLRYLQADYLNLQRNAAREKEQARDFAISKFAKDLLETVDVLSMALKSVPKELVTPPEGSSTDATSSSSSPASAEKTPETYLRELYEGVESTQRLLLNTLFKHHVKPYDPVGEKFDPNLHEALYQVPIPGKEPGTVFDTQKVGYMIKDRVLRAAQVGVVQDTQS